MSSPEKSKDDQKSLLSGLTRRQFLPLLGATAIAATTPSLLRAAQGGSPGKPSAASARFVFVGRTQLRAFPPAELIRALPSASMSSGWTRVMEA